jgi:hypothetical protein
MCIVHQTGMDGARGFECAQAGCRVCLEALMERHEGLIHSVLRRQRRWTRGR